MSQDAEPNLPRLELGLPPEGFDRRRRVGKAMWGVVALLALALACGAWYVYPRMKSHNRQLGELPTLKHSLEGVGKAIEEAETRLTQWGNDRQALSQQIARLDARVTAGLQEARKQAQDLQYRLQILIDERTRPMQERLARLETAQETERTRLAELQQELATARQQMAPETAEVQDNAGRHVAAVEQRLWAGVDANKRDLDAMARRLERRRINFELVKDRVQELAPGITIRITGTNVAYQRVTGWMWLLPDRRTLWLRGQGAQDALLFYDKQHGRRHELVITQVNRKGAVGYLLMPDSNPPLQAGNSGAGDEVTAAGSVRSE